MKESETIQAFFSRVSAIVKQFRSCGDTIENKKIVKKILKSLPPKFDHIVATIKESKDLSKMSLHELNGSLEAHEKRINRCPKTSLEQAFQSKLSFKVKKGTKRLI